MRKFLLSIAVLICSMAVRAEVTMPSFFSDNMVLQQKSEVALWGTSDSKKGKVTIKTSWDNESVTVEIGEDGKWRATVETPKYGGPYSIVINDGDKFVLNNVLIGEVWIASGQSNMDMQVQSKYNNQPTEGANRAMATCNDNLLRMFAVERAHNATPQFDVEARTDGWEPANANCVGNFSATAYFFARSLREALGDVPIGIIQTSWGGTSIDCWMDAASCAKYKDIVGRDSTRIARKQTKSHRMSSHIFNAMIAPLAGYTAKGFIWYQGCSDRFFYEQYADKMVDMVATWRKLWGNEQMPFYYAQIAPYYYMARGEKDVSQFIREQQLLAMKRIPNSGMACLSDLGDYGAIHPHRKREVGERLAFFALNRDYGMEQIWPDTPMFKSMNVKNNNEAHIVFSNAPKGLYTFGKTLADFEIAGEDGVYYEAEAKLRGATLVLKSEKVATPKYVRYGWKGWFDGGLYNSAGIPVSSFRTDNFKE